MTEEIVVVRVLTTVGKGLFIAARAGARSLGANVLPSTARSTTNVAEVFWRLEKFNGINPRLASERLHAIEQATGRRPADNVLFDLSDGVYDPKTRTWLGSLTEGGAKPGWQTHIGGDRPMQLCVTMRSTMPALTFATGSRLFG